MINLKDANGNWVCITRDSLEDYLLTDTSLIFGVHIRCLLDFICSYDMLGGKHPITSASIKELFEDVRRKE